MLVLVDTITSDKRSPVYNCKFVVNKVIVHFEELISTTITSCKNYCFRSKSAVNIILKRPKKSHILQLKICFLGRLFLFLCAMPMPYPQSDDE